MRQQVWDITVSGLESATGRRQARRDGRDHTRPHSPALARSGKMNMLSTRMFFDRTVRNVIATKNRIRHAASSEVLPSPPPTIEDRRYLTATNPRLHALAESYTAQAPAPASIWAHWLRPADFLRFRGESVF